MNHKFSLFTLLIGLLLSLLLFSAESIHACQCYSNTVCQAYSQSKSVFIGKLNKLDKSDPDVTTAYFSVEKTFKGLTEEIEQVKFKICHSFSEVPWKIGQRYFVYKEDADANHYCNRTHAVSNNDRNNDLKYAESLSETNPIFTISGGINYLSEKELTLTEVWIQEGENKKRIELEKFGSFSYKTTKKGLYDVKIVLPFRAENIQLTSSRNGIGLIYAEGNGGFKVTKTENRTTVEYGLEFKPNSCEVRQVEYLKTADAKINLWSNNFLFP